MRIAAFISAVLSGLATGASIRSQEWSKAMGIRTRLTEELGITVPILSAPMGFVAIGLMRDVSPVADILARVTKEAEALLRGRAAELVT